MNLIFMELNFYSRNRTHLVKTVYMVYMVYYSLKFDGAVQGDFFYLVVIAKGGRNSYYNQVKIQPVNRDGFSNLVVEAIAYFLPCQMPNVRLRTTYYVFIYDSLHRILVDNETVHHLFQFNKSTRYL